MISHKMTATHCTYLLELMLLRSLNVCPLAEQTRVTVPVSSANNWIKLGLRDLG